jgi:hypothetical protein
MHPDGEVLFEVERRAFDEAIADLDVKLGEAAEAALDLELEDLRDFEAIGEQFIELWDGPSPVLMVIGPKPKVDKMLELVAELRRLVRARREAHA